MPIITCGTDCVGEGFFKSRLFGVIGRAASSTYLAGGGLQMSFQEIRSDFGIFGLLPVLGFLLGRGDTLVFEQHSMVN